MARTIRASNRTVHYRTRILKQNLDRGGYAQVVLCRETRRKTVAVAQLVAEAFLGEKPAGTEVCHNDGVRVHNHPHNLRWDTRSGNVLDKARHGTHNFMAGFVPVDRDERRNRMKIVSEGYMQGKHTTDDDWVF